MITDSLPRRYPPSYEKGDRHIGVWSIQHALGIVRDGDFGNQTHAAMLDFQDRRNLLTDGVAGPRTLEALVREECHGAYRTHHVPPGSLESVSKGEATFNLGAVNWSAAGGVDVGAFQRRVYDPATNTAIERALRTNYQARMLAARLRERHDAYRSRGHLSNEDCWRCAVLSHNWPYGADRLSRGYELSDKPATWVPAGTQFDNGEPVKTYADWADFYAMGRPGHKGRMVALVTSWPQ